MRRLDVLFRLPLLVSLCMVACQPAVLPPTAPVATNTRTPRPPATFPPSPVHTPTSTPVPSPTAEPTTVPKLTWEQLKQATYLLPMEEGGPPDGLLPMEDGSFTFAFVPGAASVERYLLYRGVAFGDLNGDQVEDAVLILVHVTAGTGTFYHLAVVLNDGGQPRALAPAFLGDRIIIERVEVSRGEVALLFKTYRAEEPFGSTPTLQMAQRYRAQGQALELVQSGALNADEVVNDTPVSEAVPIVFPEGLRSVTYSGRTRAFLLDPYTLQAEAGQTATVTVTSANADVFLSIVGLEEPDLLVLSTEEVSSWSGVIPSTQEYAINVFAIGLETEYTLQVEMAAPAVTPTPAPAPTAVPPTPTPEPEAKGLVYLTFDDGPTPPYTREMLELLSQYGVQATFFVLGMNVERFPELIEAAYDAGHALGNHTFNHASLAGMSKEDFDDQVLRTAEVLGARAAPCLRPPYGATDAFTRVYAAELGYEVVMWNIDTLDWRQPGTSEIVSTILGQVYPGAIVLMHDGGGDRQQTVEAVRKVLERLVGEGYGFGVACGG